MMHVTCGAASIKARGKRAGKHFQLLVSQWPIRATASRMSAALPA
jgi:hypothetical protein